MVLLADIERRNSRAKLVCRREEKRQVNIGRLVGPKVVAHSQDLYMADHLVDRSETELGHDRTKLVGDVVKKVDDMLWRASELLSQLGVLSGDADGTSVQMTSLD